MRQKTTLSEVAVAAGVSVITASRAIRGIGRLHSFEPELPVGVDILRGQHRDPDRQADRTLGVCITDSTPHMPQTPQRN